MKTRSQLKVIEQFVKQGFNTGNRHIVESLDTPYNQSTPLGYSRVFEDPGTRSIIYDIFVAKLGDTQLLQDAEYYIKMHEYGHIYLTHLDGLHVELDQKIMNVLNIFKDQMIKEINEECKIDFAEDLINRVLDDPVLNHSLHNIAMDMEVNTCVLDKDNIDLMEKAISSLVEEEESKKLQQLMKSGQVEEEVKKKILDSFKKSLGESKVKFILPERYKKSDGTPFPDGLSYPEYLMLIIKNLSQFVKMLVSISSGGSGDTGEVTDEQLQEALKNGMMSLDDLMEAAGMLEKSDNGDGDGSGGSAGNGQLGQDTGTASGNNGNGSGSMAGRGSQDTSNSGGFVGDGKDESLKYKGLRDKGQDPYNLGKDHGSISRDQADSLRRLGKIKAGGGAGCSSSGTSFEVREVEKLDPVDEAIDDVIARTKSRVLKRKVVRDVIRNYNLGKIRSVIAPSIVARHRVDNNFKLVYLIDISGSMDTELIDRILSTISRKMKKISRGLSYDIITWNTGLGEHIKNIKAGEMVKEIHTGGGTRLAEGIRYFCNNYRENSTLIIASDFEDYLEEWAKEAQNYPNYQIYGFNYGTCDWKDPNKVKWPKNFFLRNFNKSYKTRY